MTEYAMIMIDYIDGGWYKTGLKFEDYLKMRSFSIMK